MAQKGGGQPDNGGTETWGIIILILFCLLYFAASQLFWVYATGWKWLRVVEVGAFAYLVPNFIQQFMDNSFNDGLAFLLASDPKDLTVSITSQFDDIYLKWGRWIPAAFLMLWGFRIMDRALDVDIKYDMETLLMKMLPAFPHNKQFLGIHPEETPLDFYPDDPDSYAFSMAMGERQFSQCIPPVGLLKAAERDKSLNRPIWDGAKKFDDELARKSFETQIGPMYQGYNRLSADEKTLLDQFRNKMLVKQKEVLPIMLDYTKQIHTFRLKSKVFESADAAKLDLKTLPKPTLVYSRDFGSHKALAERLTDYVDQGFKKNGVKWTPKEVDLRKMIGSADYKTTLRNIMSDERVSKHAYTFTALMSLLEAAREGATLAPSGLRWLKSRNRPLWYALNCVGKKVAYPEAAGTFAHWLLEKEAKMAIPHPEVTEAVEALRIALKLNPSKGGSKSKDDWA
ncbi:IcmP (DotM) (plasmid) [Pseudomonas silesiensis]|uniref:secretion/conjugation apparatus DotM-related subunit n=1 Tax=Pseudomonas silesiensis TaxID=1853130 RepID=UPI0030CE7280